MKRNRVHIIYWALLLSLCLHASLAPLAQNLKAVEAAKDQTPDIVRLIHQTKPPQPKPPPKPRVVATKPAAHVRASVAAHPVRLTHSTKAGPREIAVGNRPVVPPGGDPGPALDLPPGNGPATGTPAPAATPKPVCSAPFADATTLEKYTPEMPEPAREAGITGTAQVKVDLSETGAVVEASIALSSGNTSLDLAAIQAAKRTTYSPKIVDCEHVPGSYLFRVEFEGN